MNDNSKKLRSRQWSCSALADANRKILAAKKEELSDPDLEQQIKAAEEKLHALKRRQSSQSFEVGTPSSNASPEAATERGKCTAVKAKAAPTRPVPTKRDHASQDPTPLRTPAPRCKLFPSATPSPPVEPPLLKRPTIRDNDVAAELEKLRKDNERLRQRLSAASSSSEKASPSSPRPSVVDLMEPKPRPSSVVGTTNGPSRSSNPAPETEGAKDNRLRRICERKPSGRLNVPDAIHEQWAKGGAHKKALRDELEKAGWDKETFVANVTRTSEKLCRNSNRRRRAWHTRESMSKKLGWSKPYINDVCKFCEKDKTLWKKDKYNKKLRKYLVDVDDEEESYEHHEEKEIEEEQGTGEGVKFKLLDKHGKNKKKPTEVHDSGDEDTDDEKPADEVTHAKQVFQSFKKFGDSLLTRSGKLEDLASAVESYLSELEDGSNDVKRITKCVEALATAGKILETECQKVETTKAETMRLSTEKLDESVEKSLMEKIQKQIESTSVECSKVTTSESTAKNLLKHLRHLHG